MSRATHFESRLRQRLPVPALPGDEHADSFVWMRVNLRYAWRAKACRRSASPLFRPRASAGEFHRAVAPEGMCLTGKLPPVRWPG